MKAQSESQGEELRTKEQSNGSPWFLYALRCADDSIYTGVSTDLERRLTEHNRGQGARYTAGRRPVQLIGAWLFDDQSSAQRAEARFRRLPRREKLHHVALGLPVAGSPFCQDGATAVRLVPTRFCPRCGGLLKATKRPEQDRPRQVCSVCGRIEYQNAKPCAGVLVVDDGRLLLIRRAREPYKGWWDIPGGFLEADELPSEAAVREVMEETGLVAELTHLLGFYLGRYVLHGFGRWSLNIYYTGRVSGGNERPGGETAELRWFDTAELPNCIAFDHAPQVLEDWVGWMSNRKDSSRR